MCIHILATQGAGRVGPGVGGRDGRAGLASGLRERPRASREAWTRKEWSVSDELRASVKFGRSDGPERK